MIRRLLLVLAGLALVLLVVVLTLPWWLGPALRLVGPRAGLAFERYEAIGYNRWALHDVAWAGEGLRVEAERVEAGHPLAWALGTGREAGVEVGRWQVQLEPIEEAPPEEETGGGWPETQAMIERLRATLSEWAPRVELGPGEIRWPGGAVAVEGVTWLDQRLTLQGARFEPWTADATVAWPEAGGAPRVTVEVPDLYLRLQAELQPEEVDATVTWRGEEATLWARFPAEGWVPEQARARAPDWTVPGSALGISEYFAELQADLAADWSGEAGSLKLAAAGEPPPGATTPPLDVAIEAQGNLEQVTVGLLQVRAPGVEAILNQPVRLDPRTGEMAAPATFNLAADLAEVPRSEWAGVVRGQVRLVPRPEDWPLAEAELVLADVTLMEWENLQAEVRARLEWPRLVLEETRWREGAGTELAARGQADLATRRIETLALRGTVAAGTVERWLPEGLTFAPVQLEAEASGPFDDLSHRGTARVAEVEVEPLHPLALAVEWAGQMAQVRAEVAAETATGTLRGSVGLEENAIRVEALRVTHDGEEQFALEGPTRVAWAPALRVESLRLAGPALDLALALDLGEPGRAQVRGQDVSLIWINDWWTGGPLPVEQVDRLEVDATVAAGVWRYAARGDVALEVGEGRPVQVALVASGDAEGIRIERLEAASQQETVVRLEGRLPLVVRAGATPEIEIDPAGALALNGEVASSPAFWQTITESTGVVVESPRFEVDLGGRWVEPQGEARLAASRIAFDPTKWEQPIPEISDLNARFVGDEEGIVLELMQARVQGQEVRAEARLELTPEQWTELQEAPVAYLQQHGRGFIEVPGAELAALAELAPEYLAPTGQVRARVEWAEGGELNGFVRLQDAMSRPLGPLGVLQDVEANLTLAGRTVTVANLEARMGGQPLRVTGEAELIEGSVPRVELQLRGQNLPLVRQTGVLLRADLDLAMATDAEGNGAVAGTVRLRDGLFLADLQDLVPTGGGSSRPSSRPPYFSVAVDPLRNWRIEVTVEGEEFLRLRTPVLQGTASAEFQIVGTLGEPRAVGEAVLTEGTVRLPFASFEVQDAEVRLTQADPYQPQINFNGTTRRLGYDLRMEVTGTASDPRLQFFSSPPLPSEDILLLVMAGQAPQDEVTYSGSQRARQIGTFLGRGLLGDLFGGDGEERLTITTGEQISRQGRETYRFSYRLTDRLSAVGEYDEFDSYNAGLRWRLVPRSERRAAAEAEEDEEGGSE